MKKTPSEEIPSSHQTTTISQSQSHSQSQNSKIPSKKIIGGRTLVLNWNKETENNLKMINIKRLHIKKLIDTGSGKSRKLEKTHQVCLKKKLFKHLVHAEIYSFYHGYWLQDLKHAKNLTSFHCEFFQDYPIKITITHLKRLNKNLEKVRFTNNSNSTIPSHQMNQLYKEIQAFKRLQSYEGLRYLNESNKKEEFQTLHKYLHRLPNVKRFKCFLLNDDAGSIMTYDLMAQGKTYDKVTEFLVNTSPFLEPENEEYFQKGIAPFFQFQVFPNLRQLELFAGQTYSIFSSGLDSSVTQAFENLPLLDKLSLKINTFLPGLNFLLEGLLKLPQLTSFSFWAKCLMSPSEWNTLTTFAKSQQNLVSLRFQIYKCKLTQEDLLENFLEIFSHRPKLRYLSLRYFYGEQFPVFSNGLKQMVGTNQIKSFTFKIDVYGQKVCMSEPLYKPFEGLCEFLIRNRETLCELRLDFPMLQGHDFNDYLGSTISQLDQLKVLDLDIFTNRIISEEKHYISSEERMNINFDTMLGKLEKLEDLKVDFQSFAQGSSEHRSQIINLFKGASGLKNLRNLSFGFPYKNFEASEAEVNMIKSIAEELKQLHNFRFYGYTSPSDSIYAREDVVEISEIVDNFSERKSLKVNLSF